MAYTTLIEPRQLAENLHDPGWAIVDCRFALGDPKAGRKQYEESHLPGAHYAHLDHDLSSPITPMSGRHPLPDAQRLCESLGRWGISRDTQVVAYDDTGGAFAARFWWLLRWLGHGKAAVLNGGFSGWRADGLPLSVEHPADQQVDYPCAPDDQLWLSAQGVAQALADGEITLVDAREAERYRGESEPIDPVAGRVPGAINLPFKENLDARGRFLPIEQLRQRFGQLPSGAVHMCGSGVTACHNALAMAAAGLAEGRLYAGSWSEWIRDPQRPVATGEVE